MLKKSNILALVGGGTLPKFSKNKIIIWDDHQGKIIIQIRLNSDIIKVKLREDCIISILENRIYLLDINTLETIDILDTFDNPNGIFSMSNINNKLNIAFPHNKGKIQLEYYDIIKENFKKDETKIINAHESFIAFLTLNNEGNVLATASDKGTLIRLFNVYNQEMIVELRRGTKNTTINCLAFDTNTEFIACTSEVGTVHIFYIHEINKLFEKNEDKNKSNNESNKKEKNKNTKLIKVKERSFAKFKVQEKKSILRFVQNNSFVVLTSDGKFYKAFFDTKDGIINKKNEKYNIEINEEK
jgi:WD40 repeat protein